MFRLLRVEGAVLLKREHERQRRHERRQQRQHEQQKMRRRLGGQHYGKRRRHEKQKQNERQRRHERQQQMLDGQRQQCERLQQKRNGQRSGLYREPLILSDERDDDEFLPLYILLRKYFLSRLFYLNAIHDCEPDKTPHCGEPYFIQTALVDGHHMASPFLTLKMALKTFERDNGMLQRYLSKGWGLVFNCAKTAFLLIFWRD